MNALANLKAKVQEDYQSTFDFSKYNIDFNVKKEVIENEAIILRNFRTMSDSTYKVCKALYETSMKLKADKSFQAWYENIGLGKDKVSELLKRYDLYIKFPKSFQYVTSLSNQAVKILTAEKLESKILYDVVELEITKVDDLKHFIDLKKTNTSDSIDIVEVKEYKVNPLMQKETKKCVNFKNFEKLKKNIVKMDAKQIIQTEKEIETLENYIKELKSSLKNRSNDFENINALKIEFDEISSPSSKELFFLLDIKKIFDYSFLPGASDISTKIINFYNLNRAKKTIKNEKIDGYIDELNEILLRIEDKNINNFFVQKINWNILIQKNIKSNEKIEFYKKILIVLKEVRDENS